MTNKALEVRHWAELERLTGASFNVKNDSFKLRNILQAPLLQNKEEIEVKLYYIVLPVTRHI